MGKSQARVEVLQARIEDLRSEIPAAPVLKRLQLVQRRLDAEAELRDLLQRCAAD